MRTPILKSPADATERGRFVPADKGRLLLFGCSKLHHDGGHFTLVGQSLCYIEEKYSFEEEKRETDLIY